MNHIGIFISIVYIIPYILQVFSQQKRMSLYALNMHINSFTVYINLLFFLMILSFFLDKFVLLHPSAAV